MGKEKFPTFKPKIEQVKSFEQRELEIDTLIEKLATEQDMNPDDIIGDLAVFAPYKGNDSANPDYIEQVAEMIGLSLVSVKEMIRYAIKKAKDVEK